MPLLAALVPVLQGAAITVRQAIATYGLGGDFAYTRLDRVVERVALRLLPPRFAMVIANTFRRKGRLILTQVVLVTAAVMFLMVMSLSSSLTATLDAEFGRRSHDVILQFEDPQPIDGASALSQDVAGVTKADMWMSLPATILLPGRKAQQAGLGITLQGVSVADPMYAPRVVEGRWLQPGDTRVVVMNRDTAEDEHIHAGDTVTLDLGPWGKDDWRVIGLYKTFVMFGGGFSTDSIYAPRPAVLEATHKGPRVRTLLVRTASHSEAYTAAVSNALVDMFGRRNMKVEAHQTVAQIRKTADSSFAITISMLLVLAVIVGVVGGIGLTGSLSISVVERTKEIGVLRAIGGRSRTIVGMFLLEGVLQGVMAWAIAVPISLAVAPLMSDALGQTLFNAKLDYSYNYQAVFAWLGCTLVIAALASIFPARSATRISVRQSLVYE